MADKQQESPETGFTAANVKPAWLQEVEEDATYIQTKRFQEYFEEQKREAEKKAIAEARANKASK